MKLETNHYFAILLYIGAFGFFYLGITSKKLDASKNETSETDYGKMVVGIILAFLCALFGYGAWVSK